MERIRAAMQARYPAADFGPYFTFLAACPARPKGKTHRHHIAPRHQFPQYAQDKANLITLAVRVHVQAHRILTRACPALRMSTPSPAFIAAARKGGRLGGPAAATSPRWRAANRKMYRDPKWRAANAAAGRARSTDRNYKQPPLPEKKIVCWYLAGMQVSAIARKVGTGIRPNDGYPRVQRIRTLLIRAGVCIKPAKKFAVTTN